MIVEVKARGKTRHQVRYREPGNRNVKTKTFDTKGQAKIFEGQVSLAKAGVIELPKAKISNATLNEFGLEFFAKYVKVELEKTTQDLYRSVWNNHIQERLGSYSLSALSSSPELIQGFKADLIASGVGDATIAKALSLLSRMLNVAMEWGRITSNPVHAVKKPKQKRSRKVVPLAAATIHNLIAQVDDSEDKRLIALIGFGGLRPGEALALTKADVLASTLNIDKAIALGDEKGTKTGEDRMVPILSELRPFLADLPDGKLFARADGEYWQDHDYRNWRRRVFQPAIDAAGLGTLETTRVKGIRNGQTVYRIKTSYNGPRPYDLRHSFVSGLLMDGWTPPEVAEVAGHSIEVLLSTYTHVIAEMRWSQRAAA